MRLTAFLACVVALVACGGGQPEVVVGPPRVAWKDMSKEQRKLYMKKVVFPKMEPAFKGYDAQKYADFTCGTCHGDGAEDGSFKMPNPKLPKLPEDPAAFQKLTQDKPRIVDFMFKTVRPQMAELFGMPVWDADHPDGFGCHHCHTLEK